jgi:hypothetical protein
MNYDTLMGTSENITLVNNIQGDIKLFSNRSNKIKLLKKYERVTKKISFCNSPL